jgi:hypothetical protein
VNLAFPSSETRFLRVEFFSRFSCRVFFPGGRLIVSLENCRAESTCEWQAWLLKNASQREAIAPSAAIEPLALSRKHVLSVGLLGFVVIFLC